MPKQETLSRPARCLRHLRIPNANTIPFLLSPVAAAPTMRFILIFLIGAIAGAVALYFYEQRQPQPVAHLRAKAAPRAEKLRDAASNAQDSIAEKLQAWKLTPADIKADLAKTGRVVRAKSQEIGARIDDARVVAVIKAKFVLDSALSARSIGVECHDGDVTLTGTVESPDLVGRAVALALDTHGVRNVASQLSVQK